MLQVIYTDFVCETCLRDSSSVDQQTRTNKTMPIFGPICPKPRFFNKSKTMINLIPFLKQLYYYYIQIILVTEFNKTRK